MVCNMDCAFLEETDLFLTNISYSRETVIYIINTFLKPTQETCLSHYQYTMLVFMANMQTLRLAHHHSYHKGAKFANFLY